MSLHVLDTDILSLYQRGHSRVSENVRSHPLAGLATTVMTVEEQLSGWYAMVRQAKTPEDITQAYKRLADAVYFLSNWRILLYSLEALSRFEDLCAQKLKIGRTDLRIAAITLQNGGILVTRNVQEFQRVPGLQVEN